MASGVYKKDTLSLEFIDYYFLQMKGRSVIDTAGS